jgi:hypothetical protein
MNRSKPQQTASRVNPLITPFVNPKVTLST